MAGIKDTFGGSLLGSAISEGIGQIMGMTSGKKMMKRQLENQMSLNEQMQQIAQENWDYTNYENQVKHMKNAGLNVGLMYGGTGGGGQSTASSGGSASMANVPVMDIAGKTAQLQAIASQTELNKAQAEKLRADTASTLGQAGTVGGAQVANLTQGVNESKAKTAMQEIQNEIARETKDYTIWEIENRSSEAQSRARSALAEANVDEKTINEKIGIIREEYALKGAQRLLTEQNVKLSEAETELLKKDIEYFVQKYELDARRVGAQESFNKNLKEFQDNVIEQGYWKIGVDALGKVADMATKRGGGMTTQSYEETFNDGEGGGWKKKKSVTTPK